MHSHQCTPYLTMPPCHDEGVRDGSPETGRARVVMPPELRHVAGHWCTMNHHHRWCVAATALYPNIEFRWTRGHAHWPCCVAWSLHSRGRCASALLELAVPARDDAARHAAMASARRAPISYCPMTTLSSSMNEAASARRMWYNVGSNIERSRWRSRLRLSTTCVPHTCEDIVGTRAQAAYGQRQRSRVSKECYTVSGMVKVLSLTKHTVL